METRVDMNDFEVLDPVFAPRNGQEARILAGGMTFTWQGDNESGQMVENGAYIAKLAYTDAFGWTTTYSDDVMVLSSGQFYQVRIYNSAGEEIRTLSVPTVYGINAPDRIIPSSRSIVLEGQPGSGTNDDAVLFDLGATSIGWDGTNNADEMVTSGSYLVQLSVSYNGAPMTITTTSVTVLAAPSALLSTIQILPNPADARTHSEVEIRFNHVDGQEITGRLYNLAGELVIIQTNAPGEDFLKLDLTNDKISSGIYIMAVTAKAPWGTVERTNVKMVVLK